MEPTAPLHDPLLQYGKSITSAGDPLYKVRLSQLYRGISHPKQAFKDQVEQLRAMKAMSPDHYRMAKKHLPYFVCGTFHPAIRRRNHFVSIRCFLLDLDHLTEANIDKSLLTDKLCQLPEVKMVFTSPSDDGLKVLFLLEEACTDSALFSSFYQLFATQFAQQHDLLGVVDTKTSDVTRACFMSYDAKAYLADTALPVKMSDYLSTLDYESTIKKLNEIQEETLTLNGPTKKPDTSPSQEVLIKIKQTLNPNFKSPKKKEYYVPPEIDDAVSLLQSKLPTYAIELVETKPISYGRKMKVKAGELWAEINVFYGKRGYSIVHTTKTGSNQELAEMAACAFEEILFAPPET